MDKNLKALGILIIVVILISTVGCTGRRFKVGSLRTESQSVELGNADRVDVEIFMGAGNLNVTGDADKLLQADFTYNIAELKPEVEFSDSSLSVLTPDIDGTATFWDMDDYRYEWDLGFNNDVDMEMKVNMGAGQAELILGELSLTSLDVYSGAGEITLDLRGSSTLTRLDIEAGVGELTVDLTGDWQGDMDADILAGVGEMTLALPSEVCVRVDVEGGIKDTNAAGFTRDGSDYINDACGQSDVTLRIDITAGIGSINLNLGD